MECLDIGATTTLDTINNKHSSNSSNSSNNSNKHNNVNIRHMDHNSRIHTTINNSKVHITTNNIRRITTNNIRRITVNNNSNSMADSLDSLAQAWTLGFRMDSTLTVEWVFKWENDYIVYLNNNNTLYLQHDLWRYNWNLLQVCV